MKKLLLTVLALSSVSSFAQSPFFGKYAKIAGDYECPVKIGISKNTFFVDQKPREAFGIFKATEIGTYHTESYDLAPGKTYYPWAEYRIVKVSPTKIEASLFQDGTFSDSLVSKEMIALAPRGDRNFDLYLEEYSARSKRGISCRYKRVK